MFILRLLRLCVFLVPTLPRGNAYEQISNDAIQDEHFGLVYSARIQLMEEGLQVGDKWVRLSPGMAVSVEVKTGKRRLIEYFLSPLLRYKQESLGER